MCVNRPPNVHQVCVAPAFASLCAVRNIRSEVGRVELCVCVVHQTSKGFEYSCYSWLLIDRMQNNLNERLKRLAHYHWAAICLSIYLSLWALCNHLSWSLTQLLSVGGAPSTSSSSPALNDGKQARNSFGSQNNLSTLPSHLPALVLFWLPRLLSVSHSTFNSVCVYIYICVCVYVYVFVCYLKTPHSSSSSFSTIRSPFDHFDENSAAWWSEQRHDLRDCKYSVKDECVSVCWRDK